MNSATEEKQTDETSFAEQRRAALGYVMDAFSEGRMDGLDIDCLAQAALFTAFKELVEVYGEEPVAEFATRLPDRVRSGEFSLSQRRN